MSYGGLGMIMLERRRQYDLEQEANRCAQREASVFWVVILGIGFLGRRFLSRNSRSGISGR